MNQQPRPQQGSSHGGTRDVPPPIDLRDIKFGENLNQNLFADIAQDKASSLSDLKFFGRSIFRFGTN